jgi:hypothetical protein
MARSAVQSASRRLRRQLRPIFSLIKLPSELQLLVLCKCDPTSLRRLVSVSAHLKSLFLLYPESCLQKVLEQLPQPVHHHLRTSWALHNIEHADLDTTSILNALRSGDILQTLYMGSQVTSYDGGPLPALDALADLYEEVETVVQFCAQSFNTTVEAFVNPFAHTAPIELSPTEYLRFASALSILKIYHQLHLKFFYNGKGHEFPTVFLASLPAWQIQQVMSLESLMLVLAREHSAGAVMGRKHSPWDGLLKTTIYVRNLTQIIGQSGDSRFWAQASIYNRRMPVALQSPGTRTSTEGDLVPQSFTYHEQLHSYGWLFLTSIMNHGLYAEPQSKFFSNKSGFLFWDYNRLSAWGIADPTEFASTLKAFDNHSRWASARGHWSARKEFLEKQKTEFIVRWTRCPVQCSFEEWSHQATSLAQYAGGTDRSPQSEQHPTISIICRCCGETGHGGAQCTVGN